MSGQLRESVSLPGLGARTSFIASLDPTENISITVCGDGGTGKSSISLRLVRSKWIDEYDPTVQDSYSTTRVVDGRTYQLALTDTAGQEEYRGLWTSNHPPQDAYLLVYDITSMDSLRALIYFNDLIDMACETRPANLPPPIKIVAGNKCDLATARQVSSAQGLAWARSHGCGFMETSARNVVNIEETFALLVRRVVANREAAAQGKSCPYPVIRPGENGSTNGDSSREKSEGVDGITGLRDGDVAAAFANSPNKIGRRKWFESKVACCVIS